MSIVKELKYFAKDLNIIIVEDDKELNLQLVELLEVFFKEVNFAYNGTDALTLYKNKKYDIVLSDIKMPSMNGIKLSQELININKTQSIIVLSAHTEINYIVDLIDIGIKQFIPKPFEEKEFLYRLLKVCEDTFYKLNNNKNLTKVKKIQKLKEEPKKKPKISGHNQVTAQKFMNDLKVDSIEWLSIENQLEELLALNEDFENQIEKILLNEINEYNIDETVKILKGISVVFKSVDALSNISNVIFSIGDFFENLHLEELSSDKKDRLKIIEFIYEDISRFIQTVFIYQDTLDIHYLEDSLNSSLEQLKITISNEYLEEEELEFF